MCFVTGLHPWLRPLWRRLALLAGLLLWMAFEWWYEPSGTWFYIVLAVTIYAVWDLLVRPARARKQEEESGE